MNDTSKVKAGYMCRASSSTLTRDRSIIASYTSQTRGCLTSSFPHRQTRSEKISQTRSSPRPGPTRSIRTSNTLQHLPRLRSYFLHNRRSRLHIPYQAHASPSISHHPPSRPPSRITLLQLLPIKSHILPIRHPALLILMPSIRRRASVVLSWPPFRFFQPVAKRRPRRRNSPIG